MATHLAALVNDGSFAVNPYETAARAVKTVKLVAAFHVYCSKYNFEPAKVVAVADDLDWEMIAKIANVNPPSDETKELVRAAIVEAQQIAEREGA